MIEVNLAPSSVNLEIVTRMYDYHHHHHRGLHPRLTVAIGVTVGAATAILLLAIVCCVCCPWSVIINNYYYYIVSSFPF